MYHAANGGPTDGWLLTGSAEYHLYFLLVTVQLYLAFPLSSASSVAPPPARRGRSAWSAPSTWRGSLRCSTRPPRPHFGLLWVRGYELLPTYAIWVLGGCYAAVHRERLEDVVRRRVAA